MHKSTQLNFENDIGFPDLYSRMSFIFMYETLLNDLWFHKGGKCGADVSYL